ncbi:YggT family protein [Tianweitania populi]|uniref:Membrane protein n=1 Tax=Tianweitania populi TaxID=1607949 RepID=A0A8J3GMK6_9HYPH|nr:YggT family protein [Tianweitania populi]GHD17760.1 membrane protein [Tianweitania populi]
MTALVLTLLFVLRIVWWIVILSAVFSWLYAFNVINSRNAVVNSIGSMLYRLTEPVYRPIRRVMPDLGGVDISPIIVLIILYFLEVFLVYTVLPAVSGY